MGQAHKGDIGTIIKIDVAEDISSATVRKMKFSKPDGSTIEKTAVASGTTAIAFTTTVATDLDQIGAWERQAYLEMPAWKGHSTKVKFSVLDTITV
jgi:hypothetical protein